MRHALSALSPRLQRLFLGLLTGGLVATLSACSHEPPTTQSAQARLGRQIFHDPSLSASGKQSCASCHDAAFGHAPPNNLAAQLGGADLNLQGGRTAPSLRYLAQNTAFHFDAEGKATGGFFWDGRAASLEEQAKGPFLNPVEMANTSVAEVIQRLARADYADDFKALYGEQIFQQPEAAFNRMADALARYQREDREFNAYTSKYDEYLRGKVELTPQEYRGLLLFKDEEKGNCAACHPADKSLFGRHPLFTDFSYDNLGLPRNPALKQNDDPSYYDLGLCARPSGDLKNRPDLCGAFKVPSLRNVALRKALFHNGVFNSLQVAVTFYVQRDTHPEKWYPLKPDGWVNKFNDTPEIYKANINTTEAPYDRQIAGVPALSYSEIEDVVAFLKTLTDGYSTQPRRN